MPDMKINKVIVRPIATDLQGRLNASIVATSPTWFQSDFFSLSMNWVRKLITLSCSFRKYTRKTQYIMKTLKIMLPYREVFTPRTSHCGRTQDSMAMTYSAMHSSDCTRVYAPDWMLVLSVTCHRGAAMISDSQNTGSTPTARPIKYVRQLNAVRAFTIKTDSGFGCGGSRNWTAAVNPDKTTKRAVSAEKESALKTRRV